MPRLVREANQAPQEVPRGRILGPGRDAGQEPRAVRHVEDVCFFGKKRTFALNETLPARLRRAARPGLAGSLVGCRYIKVYIVW